MTTTRTTIRRSEIETYAASCELPDDAAYVVIGNDGRGPCLWGAGGSEEEAEEDARKWIAEAGSTWEEEETETLKVTGPTTYTRGDLTIRADLAQASAPIQYRGDEEWVSTPYQTADARHSETRALDLVETWLESD